MDSSETVTTTTTSNDVEYEQIDWETLGKVFSSFQIIFTVVGTPLNVWFLVAILTSREMRCRLRNKLICSKFVVNLIDTTFTIPVSVYFEMNYWLTSCAFYSAYSNICLMLDLIVNWLVVMLLFNFISQILDFDLTSRLSPRAVTIGTIGLICWPWIASLTFVPIIVSEYQWSHSNISTDCFLPMWEAYSIFRSIDTAVPVILAVVLIIVASILRYRCLTRGDDSMQTELISRGPEIDSTSVYAIAVAVCIICDFIIMGFCLQDLDKLFEYRFSTIINLLYAAEILADARVVLMPLTWLLLPDLRQRIKTWRPWHRPGHGLNLTVTYTKEDNQV